MFFRIVLSIWIVAQVSGKTLVEPGDFKLTILHVNDIHAHIEQMSEYTTRCRPEDSEADLCFGGAGRLLTEINKIRAEDPEHTLVLNAGDFYQGTIWYTVFKYEPLLKFANMVNYDALGLGNHDFDDGVNGIVPFIKGANFPVLASNINATKAPELEAACKKSVVKEIDGRRIGIIGYVTPDTAFISQPGENVTFLDEIDSVRIEAQRLIKEENVTILIALGHSGYDLDMQMAAEIEELDVVVGGHSHTFLWPEDEQVPSIEASEGPYPTFIKQAGSKKVVPVVQAYCYSKYLGRFDLTFDSKGELKTPVESVGVTKANPILLDKTIQEDKDVLAIISEYRPNMTDYTSTVGVIVNKLRRGGHEESNIGNAITDAWLEAGEWAGEATISFMNNGGIRSDIEAGEITGEDVLSVLPFANVIDKLVMNGAGIKRVLEGYAAGLCPNQTCYPGTFLQVSGLRISYLIQYGNEGNRILSIKTPCDNVARSDLMKLAPAGCENEGKLVYNEEAWCDLQDTKNYTIAIISFLARGGSRTCNFPGNALEHQQGSISDYNIFIKYLEIHNPLDKSLEGRLTFTFDERTTTTTTSTTESATAGISHIEASIVLTFVLLFTNLFTNLK